MYVSCCVGVESVNIDGGKDLVMVKGTMDAKEMVSFLTEKLKRKVEVVPPKKEDVKNKENDKGKEKKEDGGGGDKKGDVGDGGNKDKMEVNKMEHYGYGYQPSMYWYDGYAPGQSSSGNSYAEEIQQEQGYNWNQGYNNYNYVNQPHDGYVNQHQVYMAEPHFQAQQPPFYLHPNHPPPQMFSDENPNACSMM